MRPVQHFLVTSLCFSLFLTGNSSLNAQGGSGTFSDNGMGQRGSGMMMGGMGMGGSGMGIGGSSVGMSGGSMGMGGGYSNKTPIPIEFVFGEIPGDTSRILSIEFPGGRVEEFANLWKERCPEIHLQISQEARSRLIGEVQFEGPILRGAELIQAVNSTNLDLVFNAILDSSYNGNQGVIQVSVEPRGVKIFTVGNMISIDPIETPTYPRLISLEDFLTLTETTFGFLPKRTLPEFKFHPQSNLMIVHGTDGQLKVVSEIISSLQQASTMRLPRPRPEVLAEDEQGMLRGFMEDRSANQISILELKKRIEVQDEMIKELEKKLEELTNAVPKTAE